MFEQSPKSFIHTYKTNKQKNKKQQQKKNKQAIQIMIQSDAFGMPGFLYLTSGEEKFSEQL